MTQDPKIPNERDVPARAVETPSYTKDTEDYIRGKVKAELRKRMRGLRNTMPTSAVAERSSTIVATLLALPEIAAARSVALFWPIEARHEVDLRTLDQTLRASGVQIAYPAIDVDKGDLVFRFVDDPLAMQEEGYGFCEPGPNCKIAESFDVVVAPALAVAPNGHRLGYGKGYYDRFLRDGYATRTIGFAIAVAYDFQMLVELPFTDNDTPLHAIATDKRLLRITP